jgi:hypothetical protein
MAERAKISSSHVVKLNKSRSFCIQSGRCPDSDSECEFKISTQKILWCHKSAPEHVFYNLRNVPFAINNPHAIFRGLERDGHENSYCYVAYAARRFVSDTNSVPVDDDWVFLVFATSNLEIFDWRFEKVSPNTRLPENHEKRFHQLIWQRDRA